MIIQHESMNESLGNLKVATNKEYEVFLKEILKYGRVGSKGFTIGNSISSNSKVVEMQGIGRDRLMKDLKVKDENGKSPRAIYIISEESTAFIVSQDVNKTFGANTPVTIAQYAYIPSFKLEKGPIRGFDGVEFKDINTSDRQLRAKNVIDTLDGVNMGPETQYKAIAIFDDPEAVAKAVERWNTQMKGSGDKYAMTGSGRTVFMNRARMQASEMRGARN